MEDEVHPGSHKWSGGAALIKMTQSVSSQVVFIIEEHASLRAISQQANKLKPTQLLMAGLMYICYLLKIHALPLCWSLSECSSSMYCAICGHLGVFSNVYSVASWRSKCCIEVTSHVMYLGCNSQFVQWEQAAIGQTCSMYACRRNSDTSADLCLANGKQQLPARRIVL